MKIHIDNFEVHCIIGLLDFERDSEQQVLLDIEIQYTYIQGEFLDYSRVTDLIRAHLKKEKYLLLEEALAGIKVLIFQEFPLVELLSIKMAKPNILPHCSVALSETWPNTPR